MVRETTTHGSARTDVGTRLVDHLARHRFGSNPRFAESREYLRVFIGFDLDHHDVTWPDRILNLLDSLSSGRLAPGVGIGWSFEEFEALGIPFERRAQRTCEYIEVMRKLWGEEKSSFTGEFIRFDGVRSFPKPAQGAKLPIIFGGESMPALRRVARLGNGWFGVKLNPEQAAAKVATLRSLMTEAGRDISEIEVIISPYENEVSNDDLRAYHEIGVNEFVPFVRLPGDVRKIPEALERIARQWVEPARKLQ